MKLDILGLEAFVAIAEQGGFQKAADVLHITQTALTRRLQNFEELLGVKLIERTTRSVALSNIGRDFLPHGRRMLAELENALNEIRYTGKADRGDVVIACVPTVGVQYLPRIIREYSARYPQNRIKILDHASSAVADAVLRREAEFGINIAGPHHHPDLISTPLLEDRFVLICRFDHSLAKRKSLTWKQLGGFALIFAGEVSANRPILDTALATGETSLDSHYEVQRSSTAVGLVAAGVAAAVVPQLALQRGNYPGINTIPLIDPVVSRTLVLTMRRTSHLSPAAQALYNLISRQKRKIRN